MKNYIQIGSNVGDDYFQRMIENINENVRVILIEPNSDLLNMLIRNYKKLQEKHEIVIIDSCISIDDKNFTNLYVYRSSGHSSLINRKSHPLKPNVRKVKSINFNKFCEINLINEIEFLFIDTEGLDYEILNSIDMSKIDIKIIIIEHWPFDNDDLNSIYRTGPNFLNSTIISKFKNYNWEDIIIDGMKSYKLTKIE